MNEKERNIVHIRPVVTSIEENRKKGVRWLNGSTLKQILVVAVVAAVLIFTYQIVGVKTKVRVINTLRENVLNSNQYQVFGKYYLQYGKDGVAAFDKGANEIWNIAYQMNNPIVDVRGESVAIGDRNGNRIIVANKDGLKGEIYTGLPIEKISVSEQGVVAALLKGEQGSQIFCYDSVGNVLLEHQVSSSGSGYPIEVALSEDATKMMVIYMQYTGGAIQSVYKCYGLTQLEDMNYEKVVIEGVIDGTVLVRAHFMNKDNVALVGDDNILFINSRKPKELTQINMDSEISTVMKSDEKLIVALKGESGQNELRVYGPSGRQEARVEYEGNFSEMYLADEEIIMYEGAECRIFTTSGREKFSGILDVDITALVPAQGMGKYLLIEKDKVSNVQIER